MNRDKPYRLQQQDKHTRKDQQVQRIVDKRSDCNKPKNGKEKGNCND